MWSCTQNGIISALFAPIRNSVQCSSCSGSFEDFDSYIVKRKRLISFVLTEILSKMMLTNIFTFLSVVGIAMAKKQFLIGTWTMQMVLKYFLYERSKCWIVSCKFVDYHTYSKKKMGIHTNAKLNIFLNSIIVEMCLGSTG